MQNYDRKNQPVRKQKRGSAGLLSADKVNAMPAAKVNKLEKIKQQVNQALEEDSTKVPKVNYKQLAESGSEGILVADILTKKIVYANPAICRMLGYSRRELLKMAVKDIHPESEWPSISKDFEEVSKGKRRLSVNIPCLTKNGKTIYVYVNSARIKINGRDCTAGYFTDVTDYRNTQLQLKDSENKYRVLVEQIPALPYIAKIDKNSTAVCMPPHVENVLGFSPEDFINKPGLLIRQIHDEDRDKVLSALYHTHRTGEPFCYEYRVYSSDGKLLWFRDEAKIVKDESGQSKYLQGVMFDITEVKQAKEVLRDGSDELEARIKQRTSELEKLNQKMIREIKSREEIQAKLLVYRDQLRLLASELSLAEERTRRRIANDVHDHIGQNLAMAKIKLQILAQTACDSEQKKQTQEIANLVADTIESVRSLTVEISPPVLYELGFEPAVEWLLRQVRKRYGLKTDFSSDLRQKPIDENVSVFLFQAVRELLNNVTRHAQAKTVKISSCRQKNQIRVTVLDDGRGFNWKKISAIQESSSSFGLFSIRERLNYIGGKLEINSARGKGTEVIMTAPLSVNKLK